MTENPRGVTLDNRPFLLFPGQGSQFVGMCQRLDAAYPVAREVLDEASDALSLDVRDLMWRTSEEVLTQTENAQPAIVVASVAAYRVWRCGEGTDQAVAWTAGHSIGALAAAVAAGYLSVADGARLARRRGQLMAEVADEGAMVAVAVTSDEARAECLAVAEEIGVDVAAYNGARQIVLSGAADRVRAAKDRLGGRCRLLKVSNAFHSRLMDPVLPKWQDILNETDFQDADTPYLATVSGEVVTSPASVSADLHEGLRQPVRWDRVLDRASGERRGVVCGPGRSLARLWRSRPPHVSLGIVDDQYTEGGRGL
ncbi:MAG: ACP S-malonyltransferase [Propionibacteriaceae bacterium]|jgi:[acyl-carrier-protein] S-malonyltransferase|nr:ACP S-malonyltransferase [Propionibacteriaceae bacterium]